MEIKETLKKFLLGEYYDREFKEGWAPCEGYFQERDPRYVVPSRRDDKLYRKVIAEITYFKNYHCGISETITGDRILFAGRIKVTSEVLARLAEQGCKFSAYRVGFNSYIVDQINHPRWDVELKRYY